MSKKKSNSETKRIKRAFGSKLIWLLNNLSEDKLAHADELAPTAPTIMDFLMEAVDHGLDIKVGWDNYSECYQASAIGSWDGYPSAGYAVSARSNRDCMDALALVWYKVVIMADGDLSSLPSDKQVDDLRG
jgi:hypothetical protein